MKTIFLITALLLSVFGHSQKIFHETYYDTLSHTINISYVIDTVPQLILLQEGKYLKYIEGYKVQKRQVANDGIEYSFPGFDVYYLNERKERLGNKVLTFAW